MKLLALALLLANFGLWGWQYFIAAGPAQSPAQVSDTPGLLLLAEIKADEASAKEPEELPEEETAEAAAEISGGVDVAATPAPAEDDAVVVARVTPPADLAPDAAAQSAAETMCATLGPFLKQEEADAVAGRLVDAGAAPLMRPEDAEVWFGFWVYIPPYDSRRAAIDAAEKLKNRGVKELYVETSGEYTNGISLGVFRQRANAERVAGKARPLVSIGHKPDIVRRNRVEQVFWLEFEHRADMQLDTSEYEAPPGQIIRMTVKDCPEKTAT